MLHFEDDVVFEAVSDNVLDADIKSECCGGRVCIASEDTAVCLGCGDTCNFILS